MSYEATPAAWLGRSSPGIQLEPVSDRDQVATLVKALVRIAEAWKLTNQEASALLDVPPATWSRMKAGAYRGSFDRDKVTRASYLIGIYKGLRLLFNGPLTEGWPKTSNEGPGFGGRTPVELMCAGGIPALMKVRRHIDALRGGL